MLMLSPVNVQFKDAEGKAIACGFTSAVPGKCVPVHRRAFRFQLMII